MTVKQKAARLANLEKARLKRSQGAKQKKEEKEQEYDLSSENSGYETGSDSDGSDAFVITKAKTKGGKNKITPKHRPTKSKKLTNRSRTDSSRDDYKQDVDELKDMVYALATLQKKQQKATKRQTKKSGGNNGGTKIVVLPQNTPAPVKPGPHDSTIELLRKSLMM